VESGHRSGPARCDPWRAGLLFLAVITALNACEPQLPGRGPEIELEDGAVRLEPGARVHEILVRGTGPGEFEPDSTGARPGDVIRFTAGDARTHALVFQTAETDFAVREFLDATDQLRGPPLISAGTAWIVSLADAPPGRYPFTCLTHGGHGVINVEPR
jgi:plastocyanin